MSRGRADGPGADAWRLARLQHGVVSRAQLLALGFSSKAIKHRLARGRLHPVSRGVYAVGRTELTEEGRWMAETLSCGDGAVLSHRSAAALYGIGAERPGMVEISVRRAHGRQHPGLRLRRRPSLLSSDVGTLRGVPVTSPARTMLDLACVLGPRRLERAVNEADKRDVIDPDSLREALAGHAGEPGVKALRALLDRDTFLLSDDELEVLFRPLALEVGLPLPMTKQVLNGFEVDFYWPDLGLVVETDGHRYHRTPSAQSRDALRDQLHTASGLTPLRFSHHQVKHDPVHVKRVLAKTLRHLRPAAAAPAGPT